MAGGRLTIGKRIGLGFGLVLTLLLVLAAVAVWGLRGTVENAREVIEGNQLDGTLAQKEVDHLNWLRQLNLFLTDEQVTELGVQTDDTRCAFGKWLFGPPRVEAEKLVPELTPLLKQIEEPHRNLHESARKIGETFRQPHRDLAVTLEDRLSDHLAWAEAVGSTLAAESAGLDRIRSMVQNCVRLAVSAIRGIYEDPSPLSEQDRKERAMRVVASMRYGPENKDYLWINDMRPYMVMHPYKPELDGTDLSEFADPKGKKLFVEAVKVCREGGEGFVMYEWPLYGADAPVPKISYVKLFRPWNWIVGTGVYLDHTNAALMARAAQVAAGEPFSLGVELDPTLCAFGRFIDSPETASLAEKFPALKEVLKEIREPHEQLHRSARKIQELVNSNRTEDAIRVYQNETKASLKRTLDLMNRIIKAESEFVDAQEAAKRIYARETVPNLEAIQGLLRRIRVVARDTITTDQVMLDAARRTRRNVTWIAVVSVILGIALAFLISKSTVGILTRISRHMDGAAHHVAAAAGEVASSSQMVAQGTSEQASCIEETSASLEEVSSMTRRNSENADQANQIMEKAGRDLLDARTSMTSLSQSMEEITSASRDTRAINKNIDEIAFQTNLLALNAAVEAARAGEAGAGFAVVAGEVRNLAQKAADASKKTEMLIAETVNKVEVGLQFLKSAEGSFEVMADSVSKAEGLVGEIASASREQLHGTEQIGRAVVEVEKVVQVNASSAEESAAAAQEMNAQAERLRAGVKVLLELTAGGAKEFSREDRETTPKKRHGRTLQLPEPDRTGADHAEEEFS